MPSRVMDLALGVVRLALGTWGRPSRHATLGLSFVLCGGLAPCIAMGAPGSAGAATTISIAPSSATVGQPPVAVTITSKDCTRLKLEGLNLVAPSGKGVTAAPGAVSADGCTMAATVTVSSKAQPGSVTFSLQQPSSAPATAGGKARSATTVATVTFEVQAANHPEPPDKSPSSPPKYYREVYFPTFRATPASQLAGAPPACQLAGAAPPVTYPLDAESIVTLLGTTDPFSVTAQGQNAIVIYSANKNPSQDVDALADLKKHIDDLATKLGSFNIEVPVSHASSLGDLKTVVSSLNYRQFTAEDVGPDKVRITSAGPPDCSALTALLGEIRKLSWRPQPESPVQRLFFLNGSDVASALGGGATSLGGKSAGGGTGSGNQGSGNKGAGDAGSPSPASASPAGNSVTVNVSGAGASNPQTSSSNQKGGAGGQSTGKTSSGSAQGTPPTTPAASSAAEAAAPATPSSSGSKPAGTPSAASPSATSATAAGSDMVVFSEATPGDDQAVTEQKRTVAQLDLPRPEVLFNVWSVQASASDPDKVTRLDDDFRQMVAGYNQQLQESIERGWKNLKVQMAGNKTGFFEPYFSQYVGQRFIYADLPELDRKKLNACTNEEYCLGYTQLFQPLKPRITNLLLVVVAALDPASVANVAIDDMEKPAPNAAPRSSPPSDDKDLLKHLGIDQSRLPLKGIDEGGACEEANLKGLMGAHDKFMMEYPFFECFRLSVKKLLQPASSGSEAPSFLGLLRGDIADFLFNYKLTAQYPHEFSAYELSSSADALNTALAPFGEAFNQDIATYQRFLRAEVEDEGLQFEGKKRSVKKWVGLEHPSFFNNGLITVNTISGNETVVDTITQTYMDVTSQPYFSDLVKSIYQAQTGGASGASAIPKVISSNLPGNAAELVVGALSAVQSSQAKIGREFKIDLIPRTLSGASSAEINVTINAGETTEPTRYSAGQSNTDNLSRVATHNTTTKVRVDSLKLFDVSSFSARLQRSRPRFPLVPPFVELPYIGTFVGVPLRPADEYHLSKAILSAMVEPTAADLAYGLVFEHDRLTAAEDQSQCGQGSICFRRAVSLGDFGDSPIRNFHKAMVNCLETEMRSPVRGVLPLPDQADSACTELKFTGVLRDAH